MPLFKNEMTPDFGTWTCEVCRERVGWGTDHIHLSPDGGMYGSLASFIKIPGYSEPDVTHYQTGQTINLLQQILQEVRNARRE